MILYPTTGEIIKRTEEKRLNAQWTQKIFQTPEFRMKLNSPFPATHRVPAENAENAEKENDENTKTQTNP